MNALKDHPFAVEAFFERSIVLTFAVPKEQLTALIPSCLELDNYEDKWAFIAIAMVQTKGLRPKGFPEFTGNDFFLIGYRIFVSYTNNAGKRLRGLDIIKSETDKVKMQVMGNIFTHYNYSTTDINEKISPGKRNISSLKSKFNLEIDTEATDVLLPDKSPFRTWKEARKYAGPLPFTFTVDEKHKSILMIEGVRQNWIPKPIKVNNFHFEFLNSLRLDGIALANAFEITNIPYYWKKGKKETWQ